MQLQTQTGCQPGHSVHYLPTATSTTTRANATSTRTERGREHCEMRQGKIHKGSRVHGSELNPQTSSYIIMRQILVSGVAIFSNPVDVVFKQNRGLQSLAHMDVETETCTHQGWYDAEEALTPRSEWRHDIEQRFVALKTPSQQHTYEDAGHGSSSKYPAPLGTTSRRRNCALASDMSSLCPAS